MEVSTQVGMACLVIVIAIVWYITSKIYFVPENMKMITVKFGRFGAVYNSGLAILLPFERPLQIGYAPYHYHDIVAAGLFLPNQFLFDPDSVDVCSKRSTTVNVDPVMMLKVTDIQKLYFTYPLDDPFSLLVGKMQDMLNETCRSYDTIGREQFKEIASKTKDLMQSFCASIGIVILSFELQNMQLSDQRMALEAEGENKTRKMLLQREQLRIENETTMLQIESEEQREMRKLQSEKNIQQARLQFTLEAAQKRKEIASVKAETQLALAKMVQSQKLEDVYYRQLQLNSQTDLSKSILAGSHTTFVVDPSKMFYGSQPLLPHVSQ